MKHLPRIEELRDRLTLLPGTGTLVWRERAGAPKQWNTRYPGTVAGSVGRAGYIQINLSGRLYFAHRIVWALANGVDPYPLEIDHVNGNRSDNRPLNLRVADRQLNLLNSRSRGLWPKGVYRTQRGRFMAQSKAKGKPVYLGLFDTPEEAHHAYLSWVSAVHGKGTYARG